MGCNQYNIREYLEKFWSGETTLEEEKNIKDFFTFNEVPNDLKDDAVYFKNINVVVDEAFLDDDFDAEILSLLGDKKTAKGNLVLFSSPLFRMAAAVLLILGIVFLTWNLSDVPTIPVTDNTNNQSVSLNEFSLVKSQLEKNSSYKKTKNTFMLIGSKMNTIIKHAEKLNKLNQIEKNKKQVE